MPSEKKKKKKKLLKKILSPKILPLNFFFKKIICSKSSEKDFVKFFFFNFFSKFDFFFLENHYCSRWQLSGAKPTLFLNVKLFIQLENHSQYAPEDCQLTFFSHFFPFLNKIKIVFYINKITKILKRFIRTSF